MTGRYFDDDPPPYREQPAGAMRTVPFNRTTAAARIRREATLANRIGGKDKDLRDLLIYLAKEVGLSPRAIGRGMKLSRTAVTAVIKRMDQKFEDELCLTDA